MKWSRFRDLLLFVRNPKRFILSTFSPILADFRDIHKGERCFVVGTGPSLNKTNMKKLEDEITLGCNRCYLGFKKWKIRFKYWGIEDILVAFDTANEWNNIDFEKKFIPTDLGYLVTNWKNVYPIYFERAHFYPNRPKFSFNQHVIYWGGTVTYMLLQIAAIMGCNPIYLIGVDFYYVLPENAKRQRGYLISQSEDVSHFDSEYFGRGRKWHFPKLHRMKKAYEAANLETKKRGIRIYNATVDTKLDVFEKVDFDDLF